MIPIANTQQITAVITFDKNTASNTTKNKRTTKVGISRRVMTNPLFKKIGSILAGPSNHTEMPRSEYSSVLSHIRHDSRHSTRRGAMNAWAIHWYENPDS
mmetsp:Transcript_12851/g.21828  ORF Transcript_12851/g.21828 Transcript_12851/m.21828 type:complete len:100 (-) Transcript_12851:689-988(-)